MTVVEGIDLEAAEGRLTAAVAGLLRRAVGDALVAYLQKVLRRFRLGRTPDVELAVIAQERKRANDYLEAMRSRLDAKLADLMTSGKSDDEKRAEWAKVVETETRYLEMHVGAVRARLERAAQMAKVRAESPRGALWNLGDAKVHTSDCVFMAGKAWSWKVLDSINPYNRHVGCKCWLSPVPKGMRVRDVVPPDFMLFGNVGEGTVRVGVEALKPLEHVLVSQTNLQMRRLARRLGSIPGVYRRLPDGRIVFVPARRKISKAVR